MNNKRPLSKMMFERLAEGLSLRPEQVTPYLKNWNVIQNTKHHHFDAKGVPKQNRKKDFAALTKLDDDAFALTADWYHTVLLEISRNTKTPPNIKTVARVCGSKPIIFQFQKQLSNSRLWLRLRLSHWHCQCASHPSIF